jgi:hypothetical protein
VRPWVWLAPLAELVALAALSAWAELAAWAALVAEGVRELRGSVPHLEHGPRRCWGPK